MAILKRQLHSQRKGSAPSIHEDWWYLVFDTETGRFCVEHEWMDVHRNDGASRDKVELDVAAYLKANDEGPGQRELARLIATMFDDRANVQPSR
jgi:hypothetical protein